MQTVESIGVRFSLKKEIEARSSAKKSKPAPRREEIEARAKSANRAKKIGMKLAPRRHTHNARARPGVRACVRARGWARFGDFLFFSFSTDVFRLMMGFGKNLKLTLLKHNKRPPHHEYSLPVKKNNTYGNKNLNVSLTLKSVLLSVHYGYR